MSDWGDRIRTRRKELGLSQVALAGACGISQPSVADWESGKTLMIEGLPLIKAAKKLDCSPEWILTGRGAPGSSQPVELNLETLQSAIVSVKEAVKALDLEMDVYDVAPVIAFAYRERAKLPPKLRKPQLVDFDAAVKQELMGEIADERRTGPAVESGTRGVAKATSSKTKAGARG